MDGTRGRGGLIGEDGRKERSARYAVLSLFFLPTPLCFSIRLAPCCTSLSLPFPATRSYHLSLYAIMGEKIDLPSDVENSSFLLRGECFCARLDGL